MWLQFAIAILLCAVILYVPGYLLMRACTSDRIACVALASIATLTLYELLCILCGMLGIRMTALRLLASTAVVVLVVCAIVTGVKKRASHNDGRHSSGQAHANDKQTWLHDELVTYLPYIVCGLLICVYCFVKPLDGPNSFAGKTDNTYHLNLIRAFLNTGDWSLLHANIYSATIETAAVSASYYPAVWHIIPTMLCQLLGCQPALASNALIAVLLTLMEPTSVYLFLRTVLYKKPLALRLGAVLPLAFGVYPWQLIMETKFPFLLGNTISIVSVALLISYLESVLAGVRRPKTLIAFVLTLFASALAHPISLFSTGVICAPYIVWTIWRAATAQEQTKRAKVKGVASSAIFLAFVCVVWTACYYMPGMRAITEWAFKPYASVALAVTEAILLGFKNFPPEIFLALIVWLGMFYSLYRKR